MNRLGVYVIYDFDNIIDDYIGVMLENLRTHLSKLIVVCIFLHIKKGYENLKVADEVIFRENKGYDAGAYKDVLCKLFNSNYNFDEILITDDSYYGPIDSFNNIFDKMENIDCDYWGITKSPERIFEGKKLISHIQSYFMCFKKNVIKSTSFCDFWKNYFIQLPLRKQYYILKLS